MALTAARTELNVSLVGEDETIRMLEDAKKRMADLEAKTRDLTGATKGQTEAAQRQTSALEATNGKLKGLAEKAEGVVGGVDKVKGAVEKVVGVFGFLGAAVTGAITAYEFLTGAFDDSKEKAEEHEKQLAETKKKTDALKEATDKLTSSLAAFQSVTKGAAATLAGQRAEIARLQGDTKKAAQEMLNAEAEAASASATALREKKDAAAKAASETGTAEVLAIQKVKEAERSLGELRKKARDLEQNQSSAIFTSDKEAGVERRKELQKQISLAEQALRPERESLRLATKAREEGEKAVEVLRVQVSNEERIAQLRKERAAAGVQEEVKPDKPRGGGAAKQKEEDPEENRQQLIAEATERGRVIQALYEEQKAREAVDRQMREAMETSRVELFKTLPELRQRLKTDLATLPVGATFDSVRKQLAEQLKAVDVQLADLKALAGLEDVDLLASATEKQVESLTKLQEAYLGLSEARAKAREEAEKLREQMERDNIAGFVSSFSEAMQGLGDIQGPVFEAVTQSLSGVTAQMEKFKGGQQTLTQAVVGSGAAIAAAVAKQVDSVRVEAGIRAIFETAMGFANLGNPAIATGHFTAAAMFGLVAAGAIPAQAKAAPGGGQKAPAKAAASTRESEMGGGGGAITNVYNLQTGIIDGQSTAMAFRRAEMTARNTGMASAGGW